MTRYRVSGDAALDLDEIFLYWVRRVGLEAADRLIDSITARFWLVGEHPDAGRPSDEAAAGVKWFSARKYHIYCARRVAGQIFCHIFHGARDQRRAFKNAARRQ
jgi:plasmid stabilization system protein ParE